MIRLLESIIEKELLVLINNINDNFKNIVHIKQRYDNLCNSIYDKKSSKNYLFNIKLLDAKNACHGEKYFNTYAEDMWNEWIEGVEEITNEPYDEIIIHDNSGTYMRFSRDYIICCDEEIDFSNMIDFLKSLEDLDIITLFYEKNLNQFIINDEIDINKIKESFRYEDENALTEYIVRLNKDLNDIYTDLNEKINCVEKIITLYNNIKENQIKNISLYK